MQLNVRQQNHLNGFHSSFFSNIKSSYLFFVYFGERSRSGSSASSRVFLEKDAIQMPCVNTTMGVAKASYD